MVTFRCQAGGCRQIAAQDTGMGKCGAQSQPLNQGRTARRRKSWWEDFTHCINMLVAALPRAPHLHPKNYSGTIPNHCSSQPDSMPRRIKSISIRSLKPACPCRARRNSCISKTSSAAMVVLPCCRSSRAAGILPRVIPLNRLYSSGLSLKMPLISSIFW